MCGLAIVITSDYNKLQQISSSSAFTFLLYSYSHNTEKVIYFLLLDRKRRRPALEDDEDVRKSDVIEVMDPPRKRLDTCRINGQSSLSYGQISEGSPLTPRRSTLK